MKFVCNNCGFTADIPVRRTTCPMCGSSNVSFSADTLILPENEDEDDKINTVSSVKDSASAKSCKKCGKKSCKCKILTVAVILILAALVTFFFLK